MRLGPRLQPLAAYFAALLLKAIARSVRWQEEGTGHVRSLKEAGTPMLMAFWHGRLAMIPAAYARVGGQRVKILISEHRDGEFIAQTMAHWGYEAVRGSTRRSAIKGARGMLRAARQGYDLAITPDGPRGPRECLQEGVLELARWTGLPIVPVCFAASRAWRFSSWDGFLLPKPGSRILVQWGEPIWVPAAASEAQLQDLRGLLEGVMRRQRMEADRRMGWSSHNESVP